MTSNDDIYYAVIAQGCVVDLHLSYYESLQS